MRTIRWMAFLAGVGAASIASADPLANQLFGAKTSGSAHVPQAVGTYAKGCGAGLVQLPETGPTWQAMRLSRNRNWGVPETVDFIERLSAFAARQPGWSGLYVGDISQPRGGPMLSGHSSHQVGLDIDIWMLPPKSLRLSQNDREKISSISVRASDQRRVNGNWSAQHAAILEAAARDDAVDRIFVTPPVKVELCKSAKQSDRSWMQKIRPLYGHDTHFHVRLKCPKGDTVCETQTPTVAQLSKGGNGCDETLEWWVTDYLNPPKATKPSKPAPKTRGVREYTMADLPNQCQNVLVSR
ncbi:penicillin-insensitive murein endopeptidase [Pseudoruegeria sp. SK021]|uniref:penicillin-insensitive murein endopeptidase n=1 Tax=Pseudoruegeria sp. SK021 TaxID=1933035 RepID=UPI000A22B673|nr:penicillin-insensitive murein endopeptidase [Pseudoruegeria sp. SK021]OSP55375.1 penicillin-insensitive murein endopeptidase [Pseudoruegeria sp. SK021]